MVYERLEGRKKSRRKAYLDSAFNAMRMPSLTPVPAGTDFIAIKASLSE
jgi:hypothetical protein